MLFDKAGSLTNALQVVFGDVPMIRIKIEIFKTTGKYNTEEFVDIPVSTPICYVRAEVARAVPENSYGYSRDFLGVPFIVDKVRRDVMQ
jgi:hypothetical protein